jgi:endonuclease/exonuclease/phosphatase family metal-dependent hydrolase
MLFKLFSIIKPYLCLLGRAKRIFPCFRQRFHSLTNCGYTRVTDKPRSIVTWNIQGLFMHMNDDKTRNILYQLKRMNDIDIICLQEVFENSLKDKIIYELRDNQPYYLLGDTYKRYLVGEDSGLMILSKYPIEFVKEHVLEEYNFPDRMANKTVLYFKVGDLNLMTTHLQSNNMFDNTELSSKQLRQIIEFSPFEKFIITGDLNNNNSHKFLRKEKNNFDKTWLNQTHVNLLKGDSKADSEILDYIFPHNYDNITVQVNVPKMDITNCSDHFPLFCKIDQNKIS